MDGSVFRLHFCLQQAKASEYDTIRPIVAVNAAHHHHHWRRRRKTNSQDEQFLRDTCLTRKREYIHTPQRLVCVKVCFLFKTKRLFQINAFTSLKRFFVFNASYIETESFTNPITITTCPSSPTTTQSVELDHPTADDILWEEP